MRKNLKNKWLKIIGLNCLLIFCFSVFYGEEFMRYSITKSKAGVYADKDLKSLILNLSTGFTFTAKDDTGKSLSFLYNGQEYWIKRQDVMALDFSRDNFSESSILYDDVSVLRETSLNFFYRGELFKIGFQDPKNPKIISRISLTKLVQLKASHDQETWILFGNKRVDLMQMMNVAIFDAKREIFTPLAVLNMEGVSIKSIEFSPEADFVSILLSTKTGGVLLVYDLQNGLTFSFEDDIFDLQWLENKLILYQKQGIFLYDFFVYSGKHQKFPLYLFSKPMRKAPDFCFVGGKVFLSLDNAIFKISPSAIFEKTTLKNLSEASENLVQIDKNTFRCNNKIIRELSGVQPKWVFLSLLDHNMLLCKKQDGLVPSLFIYDVKNSIQRELKWVEDPKHVLSNMTFVDVVFDKNEVWFVIEKPEEFVKLLKLDAFL